MTLQREEELKSFVGDLEDFTFENSISDSRAEENIIFYIVGYIARSICKVSKFKDCNNLVSFGKIDGQIKIDVDDEIEEFVKTIRRVSFAQLAGDDLQNHLTSIYSSSSCLVHFAKHLRESLKAAKNPKDMFISAFVKKLKEKDETAQLLSVKFRKGHELGNSISRIAFSMFNIKARNYASEKKDEIHKGIKRGATKMRSSSSMKIKKLNSN